MTDESYIQLTLELARKGRGMVSPNPLVGAVVVKGDRIAGAGYHERFGGPHAEVNALNSAGKKAEGATLYVNLEPCNHHGKTPPCTELIIEKKIKRVVIGTLDANPLVSGKGVKRLIAAGIDVKVGVLEHECLELNRHFFKSIIHKSPYITLKIAQTLDGKIADKAGDSKWITSRQSRRNVHFLRARYDAVLVGTGTLKKDDPRLTVRLTEGRDPVRVVLDAKLTLPEKRKIFDTAGENRVIVITTRQGLEKKRKAERLQKMGVELIAARRNQDGTVNLKSAMKHLYKHGISSVMVEGGGKIFSDFLRKKLFDEIRLFISPKILGGGLDFAKDIGIESISRAMKLRTHKCYMVGNDMFVELRR